MKTFANNSRSWVLTALLFVCFCFLFFNESFAQTTFSFEPSDGWPDSNGSTETVSGGTLTQSIYQFTTSSAMFTTDGISTAGTQALWATNFTNGETFTLQTTDGSEFDFRSLELIVYIDDAGIAVAEGFKDGVSTGTQTTGTGFGAALATGTDGSTPVVLSVTFDNSIFDDVDRVVLTSGNNFGWSTNLFDELVIGPAVPLPITLIAFQAQRLRETVQLQWSTANELNNKGFEIEQSIDGQTFEQVGFVEGVGNSSEKQDYSFSLRNTSAAYYRFKQIDLDGAYDYSPIRFIAAWESDQEPLLFPNPTSGKVSLANLADDMRLLVDVVDMQGLQLAKFRGNKLEVEKTLSQNIETYPSGMYLIRLRTPDRSFIQKIFKE